jgi:hypothetical protein
VALPERGLGVVVRKASGDARRYSFNCMGFAIEQKLEFLNPVRLWSDTEESW